jgi:small-conductance mechanosensitive channel
MGQILPSILPWVPSAVLLFLFIILLNFLGRFLFSQSMAYRIKSKSLKHALFLSLIAFCLVVVVLSLPLTSETRAQIFSLLGIAVTAIIALSSTTFVGNAMAGLMLKVVDGVEPGDFLMIGDFQGRVTEMSFLHTEIQNEDRNLITLPNLFVVTNPFTILPASGTIVSAKVSLGYDVCRHKIEEALLKAGELAGLKEAFVQIIELGDYSVNYRIAGLLTDVKYIISFRARLRTHMLDCLHKASIEIVSPKFMNQRVFDKKDSFISKPNFRKKEDSLIDGKMPEEMLFSKADDAESKEKIKDILEKVSLRIKGLKEDLSKEKDPDKIKKIESSIDLLLSRKSKMEAHLSVEVDD